LTRMHGASNVSTDAAPRSGTEYRSPS
jgi:hypothetical protein